MPFKRNIRFPVRNTNQSTFNTADMSSSTSSAQPTTAADRLTELLDSNARIEELSSAQEEEFQEAEDSDYETSSDSDDGQNVHAWMASKLPPNLPFYFASPGPLLDNLETPTSIAQEKTMREVIDLMTGKGQTMLDVNTHGLPHLLKAKHAAFLRTILGKYPPPFQVMDASRPWLLYWALNGLRTLGVDVSEYRQRCIDTFTPLQNPEGGFGGGHGHLSHAAASYAATLSLALVDGLDMIDRRSMWHWLGQVKNPSGGFNMAVNGEQDVRGAYCCMTIHTLLHLPLALPPSSPARAAGHETFTSGLGAWISKCQTFEGGLGGAPDNEAHGAYAFCVLACLCLLDDPAIAIPTYLNTKTLTHWLVSRQACPEGGFSGRTNKLVDACYSHWVGGCWSLLESALSLPPSSYLWDREGLVRYTLTCSQAKKGGLRDKPSTRPDGYHTNYSLAGLSAAQYIYTYNKPQVEDAEEENTQGEALKAAFNWSFQRPTEQQRKQWCFDLQDMVEPVHPVFVLPFDVVEDTRSKFAGKVGF
ncbi:terpenoid cyclases/Protein prenyltransferase [Aureobasidium pullulans]|uniref:Terpenoid cyclases/Protein prenyltransferase n=1 Tax=Aureobasidium pullulans TaxID=5580 RepID=A0A4S9M062_AURPU|nr:terpenoid cyclases/Protein prenyltransferase [Aureobasidium pullulans]